MPAVFSGRSSKPRLEIFFLKPLIASGSIRLEPIVYAGKTGATSTKLRRGQPFGVLSTQTVKVEKPLKVTSLKGQDTTPLPFNPGKKMTLAQMFKSI